jgi:hypothetical protein
VSNKKYITEEIFRIDPFSKTPWPFCEKHGAMHNRKNGDLDMFSCPKCSLRVAYNDIFDLEDIVDIPGVRTGTREEWEADQPIYNISILGEETLEMCNKQSWMDKPSELRITNPAIEQSDNKPVNLVVEIWPTKNT